MRGGCRVFKGVYFHFHFIFSFSFALFLIGSNIHGMGICKDL